MALNIEQELLAEIVGRFQREICNGKKGAINPALYRRAGGKWSLPQCGGFAAPAAAYLALTDRPDNPYFGRADVLQFAFDAADRLMLDHVDVGVTQAKPNHFTIFPLTALWELAAGQAGAKRRAQWRDLMHRNLKPVDALIDRTWPTLGKPGPWAGTGPNHIFGWLAVGYGQAKALGDERRMQRYEKAFLKHLRIQSPAGYFPEHNGPVLEYHAVSLEGVAEFHHHCKNATIKAALERGVAYFVRVLYPDLRCIETLDERNRLGHGPGLRSGLIWSAEGRGMARLVLAAWRKAREQNPALRYHDKKGRLTQGGVEWWALGGLYRAFEQAGEVARRGTLQETPPPLTRPQFAFRLENKALIRKDGPWFYALSGYSHPTLPGNPYHLERTQAFSLYHEKTGLIIGGGNDKRAPHNSTVHVVEEKEVHYYPALNIDLQVAAQPEVLAGARRVDGLDFEFGCAQAQLEVAVQSPHAVRVGLKQQTNMVNYEIALVLQLKLFAPALLRTGPARGRLKPIALKPMQPGQPMAEIPLGAVLELPGRWRMHFSTGATGAKLCWPHRPWNPYVPPDYREPVSRAVALVRIVTPPGARGAAVTVEVTG